MNLLTIIVIIIFAISILRGYRKGFIKSLASMVSIILSIILVNFATPYVSDFLKTQTPVYDYILEKCEDAFSVSLTSESRQQTNSSALQDTAIEALPIPEVLRNLLKENNTPEKYAELAVHTFTQYVPSYMANLILSIVSFVVSWILVISFLWLAVMTLDFIAELPVIHGINQILGLVLGFFQGLIIIWIAFLIITVFSHTNVGGQLMAMITESPILETLYDANILLNLLTDILANFV